MGISFLTGFSGAIMPGPLLVAAIALTASQGYRAVAGLIAGHFILEIFIVSLLVVGLQSVIQRPRVRGVIGVVGGGALIYMGVDMLRHLSAFHFAYEAAGAGGTYSWLKLIMLGIGISAANPYFTGWWATIGAGQLVHMAPRSLTEYAAFLIGHEGSDVGWYFLVAFAVIHGEKLLSDPVYRGLIGLCAVLIAILGLRFLVVGGRLMMGRM